MTHAHDARLTQRFVRDRWFKWLNDTERLTPKAGATNGANLGCLSFDEVVELTLGWEVVFDDFSRLHDVFFTLCKSKKEKCVQQDLEEVKMSRLTST